MIRVADVCTFSLNVPSENGIKRCPPLPESVAINEIIVKVLPRPIGSAIIPPANSLGSSS